MNLKSQIVIFFKEGELRSLNAKKNILSSLIIKGLNIVIYMIVVPLTLSYLNAKEFGLWLTLSSILMWINYFDIGLGNGLRNKLSESMAVKDYKLSQVFFSTTLALMIIIISIFIILFIVINPFLNWSSILNTDISLAMQVSNIVVIIFVFFCLQLIFRLFGVILIADQKPAINDLVGLGGSALSLLVIFILSKTTSGSLVSVALTFSAAPVIIMIAILPLFYFGKYAELRPKISAINFNYTKQLMGVGLQFFIIQLAVCIVVYTSTNIIITQLFDSTQVTIYNIAYKYLYTISMVYIIIITPFWSASTEAYINKDFLWINKAIKKLLIILGASVLLTILMILFSNSFYVFWIGHSVQIPFSLTIVVAFYVTLFNWSNTFVYIINGIGKIRVQLYATVFISIIYIPLAVFLGKLWGVNGVIIASCISLLPTSILMPIQCYKLLSNRAKGVWEK